jgi:hypothetical protein
VCGVRARVCVCVSERRSERNLEVTVFLFFRARGGAVG